MSVIISIGVMLVVNLIFAAISAFFSPVMAEMIQSITGLTIPQFPFPQNVMQVASYFFPLQTAYVCIVAIINAYSVKLSMVAIKYFTKLL